MGSRAPGSGSGGPPRRSPHPAPSQMFAPPSKRRRRAGRREGPEAGLAPVPRPEGLPAAHDDGPPARRARPAPAGAPGGERAQPRGAGQSRSPSPQGPALRGAASGPDTSLARGAVGGRTNTCDRGSSTRCPRPSALARLEGSPTPASAQGRSAQSGDRRTSTHGALFGRALRSPSEAGLGGQGCARCVGPQFPGSLLWGGGRGGPGAPEGERGSVGLPARSPGLSLRAGFMAFW